MNIYLGFVLALTATFFVTFLKKTNPEIALCLVLVATCAIFFIALDYIETIIQNINSIDLIQSEIFSIPLKLLGLSIMSKICSSICEDSGEKGLSTAVVTVTKFASVLIAFPLFQKLLEQIKGGFSL